MRVTRHRWAWGPLTVACLLWPGIARAERPPFDAGVVDFAVSLNGERSSYRVFSCFVLPGQDVSIVPEAPPGRRDGSRRVVVTAPGRREEIRTGQTFRWRAPATPGLTTLEVSGSPGGTVMRLNVFVMRPATELRNGAMGDYHIGTYPRHALRGLAIYTPPRGFVEVTRDLLDIAVSPHFTLGQFVCKQESTFPKYLVLRARLLLKLELLLQHVNAAGHRCDGFVVMSGYRTPAYNAAIGNVTYSRHQWGGAADIYIDEDGDAVMDDLNRDGRSDERDADVLKAIVESISHRTFFAPFVGGLARYRANSAHGPFVHVDVRGSRARWGD